MSSEDKKKHTSEEASDSEELQVDFSKVTRFFKDPKLFSILIISLMVLVPVIFTFYIRLAPEGLPQTDAWARSSVDNFFRSQLAANINSQYPNLPQSNKEQLISQQYAEFKKSNQALIDQQVQGASQYFKTGFRYEENGNTYTFLGDLDSYFYLRQARNLEAKGSICDELNNGECWDNYILAPLGGPVSRTMHPYGIVFLKKTIGIFDSSINLMRAAFLLPTFLAAIAALAAFFIGRRLMNEVAGFFAAMFVALNPMMITRTLGSDTDIWNVTMPLVIIWTFIEAFEAKGILKKSILSTLSGILIGAFAFAWGGWWYVFDFILAAVFSYMLLSLFKSYVDHRKLSKAITVDFKHNLLTIGILFVSTMAFVTVFLSFGQFTGFYTAPLSTFTTLKAPVHPTLWPNVFTTVAELNEANIPTIVSQTTFGIRWLFSLALLGIVFTLVRRKPDVKEYVLIGLSALLFLYLITPAAMNINPYIYLVLLMIPVIAAVLLYLFDKHSHVDVKPAILFTLWFMVMILASIKGVRFILLLTPIFAIAVGVAIGYVYQYFVRMIRDDFKLHSAASHIIVFLLLGLILITPVKAGISAGQNFTPSMTKGWYDTLTKINIESAPDAIINSWWDFGHWFKYVADRRVTLDGVTQNHPNAHWLGLILQTSNEREALGILRMLDCGSNNAFEEVNKKIKDTEKSENIISKLVVLNRQDGESYLGSIGFTGEEAGKVSEYTYCEPPENYFITSEDMIGKAGVWAHFGLWNFDRAYMINFVKPKSFEEGTVLLKNRFNYSDSQASSTYYELQGLLTDREVNDWVSPWPNYMTGDWIGGCRNALQAALNTETNETYNISTGLLCPLNIVLSENANGRNVVEGLFYRYDNPLNSTLVIAGVSSTGQRGGSAQVSPSSIVLSEEGRIIRHKLKNSTFPYDIVLDAVNNRTIIAAPELSESLFTKLYYLDGRHTKGFEKFSDITDITGLRIVVWKVNWSSIDDYDNIR